MNKQNRKVLIGSKIRNYRKKRGLTQEQLCSILDIDISGYSDTENGKSSPLTETLCKIMEELNIKPSDLFDFIEYESTEEDIVDSIIVEKIKSLNSKNKQKVIEFIDLIKK